MKTAGFRGNDRKLYSLDDGRDEADKQIREFRHYTEIATQEWRTEAYEWGEKCLNIRVKRLGKSHPLTIQSYLQLAYVFEHVDMRHKALQCYEELLAQQNMFMNASTMSS